MMHMQALFFDASVIFHSNLTIHYPYKQASQILPWWISPTLTKGTSDMTVLQARVLVVFVAYFFCDFYYKTCNVLSH